MRDFFAQTPERANSRGLFYFLAVDCRVKFFNVGVGIGFAFVGGLDIFAATKRISINFCNAVGDFYVCKAGASIKRILSYAFNAVGDCYACKAGAKLKRTISYAFNAVRDCYT